MLALAAALCSGAHARRNVLLIYDEDNDLPGLAVINRSLREVLRSELKEEIEFYSESLNLSQFKNPGHPALLREHLQRKYEGRRLDLIIAVLEPSLEFLLRQDADLFPGVPIVFCGVDPGGLDRRILSKNVTGVLLERDFAPTLEIALRLQPEIRNVFVVGGTSKFDRHLQAVARRDLRPFEDRVRITWPTAQPMDELLSTLSQLPPNSVIYYLTLFADGRGDAFVTHEALSRIARVANAPIYVALDQYLGLGAVGGNVYSVAIHGQQAAEIGARVLRGEAPAAIPIVALSAQSNQFDGRALQRWGLDEARLPPGSAVGFRMPSLWDTYRWHVAGGIALFLLQTGLVVGLLANRAQRLRAERARQESERRRLHAEEQSRKQRDELAHALRVTTLGELAVSIAHELNQPLTAIAANAQAARMLLSADPASPELGEALDDVAKEAYRAGETVHRLRALFRKQPAGSAPVDLNPLIEDVLRLLAPDMRSRAIQVRFVRDERLPAVLGDGVQLRQVVLNLLVNAQEAIAVAGEGRREIRVLTRQSDPGHVVIEIGDSGIGVEASELERIFVHFVSSKPDGLGMGLAISRSIVEAHNGRIWATRNEVLGLTLHVELPAGPTTSRERAGPSL